MQGLPREVDVGGVAYEIRCDYESCLTIMEAFQDPELTSAEQQDVMLRVLFFDVPPDRYAALLAAKLFLDCGKEQSDDIPPSRRLIDWQQDEQMIFAAVNRVAGKELRDAEPVHWWTFCGYFDCIGEGLLSTVINIRRKKSESKKLEKYEQEFYVRNRELVDLRRQMTQEEMDEFDKF